MRRIVPFIILTLMLAVLFNSLGNITAHAAPLADAVQPNPISINWMYATHHPREVFTVYIDVINVQNLLGFQCGFGFNPNVLQIAHITIGTFLGLPDYVSIPEPPWDNQNGIVPAYGAALYDPMKARSGSGHLLKIDFQINSALWPPYSGDFPGTSVTMMNLTDANGDPCELMLFYNDGVSEITPTPNHIYDGSFKLSIIKGDINYDGAVDISDATQIGLWWLQTSPPAPVDVDVNRDGNIDIQDATKIGLNWLLHT